MTLKKKLIKDLVPGETFLDSFGVKYEVDKITFSSKYAEPHCRVYFKTPGNYKMFEMFRADRLVRVLAVLVLFLSIGCATQPLNNAQRQYLMSHPINIPQQQFYQMPVQKNTTVNTTCSQMGGFINCQSR